MCVETSVLTSLLLQALSLEPSRGGPTPVPAAPACGPFSWAWQALLMLPHVPDPWPPWFPHLDQEVALLCLGLLRPFLRKTLSTLACSPLFTKGESHYPRFSVGQTQLPPFFLSSDPCLFPHWAVISWEELPEIHQYLILHLPPGSGL